MTPQDRISYLVYYLEGGNAKKFADKAGISPAQVSRLRKGLAQPTNYYSRILKAYPEINSDWLIHGEGFATIEQTEKSILLKEFQSLRKEVESLRQAIEKTLKSFSKVSQGEGETPPKGI